MNDPLMDFFIGQWKFLRTLTNDLLKGLSTQEMDWSPSDDIGPWWKQIRHVGRVQENYLNAIGTGVVKFGFDNTTYFGGSDRASLQAYLIKLDDRQESLIHGNSLRPHIDWFGKQLPITRHFLNLADHELLHHGQWIIYARLLGRTMPPSWRVWGV